LYKQIYGIYSKEQNKKLYINKKFLKMKLLKLLNILKKLFGFKTTSDVVEKVEEVKEKVSEVKEEIKEKVSEVKEEIKEKVVEIKNNPITAGDIKKPTAKKPTVKKPTAKKPTVKKPTDKE